MISGTSERKWWKEAVVYQIWPHSFASSPSKADGVGDLRGIISRLPYLSSLGVTHVWLSPIYPSPFVDHGYDISNFVDINPLYGTMSDWDTLRDEAGKLGMGLLMDLVLNHCSVQHPWFRSAISDTGSRYKDYFFWHPGANPKLGGVVGNEPNNYRSVFGGPAWTYVDSVGSWYFHNYDPSQPDLNWECDALRKEMRDVVRFWCDKGIKDFRIQSRNPPYRVKDPSTPYQNAEAILKHGPRLHEYLKELRREVLDGYDVMTIGEMSGTSATKALEYIGPGTRELDMIFQFELMAVDSAKDGGRLAHRNWTLPELKAVINDWQTIMYRNHSWNANYLSNHDQGRPVSKWGNDSPEFRTRSAKLLAAMECTLPGTLCVYQGEELAMKNFPANFSLDDLVDVQSKNYYAEELESKRKSSGLDNPDMSDIITKFRIKARDNGRMPVPWDSSLPNAGFCGADAKPWMKLNREDIPYAAAQQESDKASVLNFWRDAIKMRKENPVFVYGEFRELLPQDEAFFAYELAEQGRSSHLVILNWSDEVHEWSGRGTTGLKLLLSNGESSGTTTFLPWEARVYAI